MKKITALVLVFVLAGCISQPEEHSLESEFESVDDIVDDLKGLSIDEFFEESYKQLLLRNP